MTKQEKVSELTGMIEGIKADLSRMRNNTQGIKDRERELERLTGLLRWVEANM